jgi:hypothetical protein
LLLLSLATAVWACESGGGGKLGEGDGGTDAGDDPWELISIALTPANAELTIENGTPANQEYTAIGTFGDGHTEDITDDATFELSVAKLGSFDGATLTTTDVYGGLTTVSAEAFGVNGITGLSINVHTVHVDDSAPENAADLFEGEDDPSQAPTVLYPPDGVLIPPNLADVDFMWDPGAGNDLWQVAFSGEYLEIEVYLADTSFIPEDLLWQQLVPGNGGLEPVEITVRGTSTADPSTNGTSAPVSYGVAEEPIEGGVYYWAAASTVESDYGIFRYDFGQPGQLAEEAYTTVQTEGRCVACHALSHDGTKMALNYDGGNGQADIIDVASQTTILPLENYYWANFHTYSADDAYVLSVYTGVFTLRNGETGAVVETLPLSDVTYPDWSLDGGELAFTRVTRDFFGDWYFYGGQIEIMTYEGPGLWGVPDVLVPAQPDVNFYYPAISPDGDWVVFNKSFENSAVEGAGDSYSDDDAHLWVVSSEGGDPISLEAVNLTGNLRTSWAKWCPHVFEYDGEPLLWFTVSSMRAYGSKLADGELPQIWMAAFSPERAENGEDPTWPAFYLPFQDITTNNHIAQWTEIVVDIQ